MKKSIIAILIIILIIVIGVFVFSEDNNSQNNTLNNETQIKETENEQNEQVNQITGNEVINEITNELLNEEMQSTETFEESPKTAEEKAIDIVKKDWGKDASVNFSVEGMDGNGNYIVTVRNSDTVALAFYSVNVTNKNFTKREMN